MELPKVGAPFSFWRVNKEAEIDLGNCRTTRIYRFPHFILPRSTGILSKSLLLSL